MALVVNNLPANVGDVIDAGLIPGWGSNINTHTHTHTTHSYNLTRCLLLFLLNTVEAFKRLSNLPSTTQLVRFKSRVPVFKPYSTFTFHLCTIFYFIAMS